MDHLLLWRAVASAEPTVTGFLPLTVIATSLGNLSIWWGASQPALLAAPKLTEGGAKSNGCALSHLVGRVTPCAPSFVR